VKDVADIPGTLMHLRKYWINIPNGKKNGLPTRGSADEQKPVVS